MDNLILKGPPGKVPKIEVGIGEYFFEQVEKIGDTVFQIDGDTGKRETFQDVKRRSTTLAVYLQDIGIKPKDIVLLCCENNLDNIVPALAAQFLGAYVASLNPKQDIFEVKYLVALVEPKVIVAEKGSLNLIEEAFQHYDPMPVIISIGDKSGKYPDMLDIEQNGRGGNNFRPVKVNSRDVAAIMFSSGTTSMPKGIYISHWALLNNIGRLIQQNLLKPGVSLHFSPLCWVTAWIATVLCIVTGTAKVIAPAISGKKFLELIENYKVTNVLGSSIFAYEITALDEAVASKYDTSSFNSFIIGGSNIDPNQMIKLRRYLPHTYINLTYGSTETNMLSGHDYTDLKAAKEKISSSGCLLPEVQMKFVDVDTGKLLGPNEAGEIFVKSDYTMLGYHKYSKPNTYDKDGFLKAGDMGYYDEDGYIYITDRLSEVFKYKEYEISPSILQNVIMEHPAVAEAVVVGIPHIVDQFHAAAAVVLKPGATTIPEEIIRFVNSKVDNSYQLRGGIIILEAIPQTFTGKYQRRSIRDRFKKVKEGNFK